MSLEARGGVFGEGESSDIQDGTHPERLEEPLVLPTRVPVLQQLLDLLLRVLPLRHLLEGFRADGALETLELKCVTRREQVGVVHDLYARSNVQYPLHFLSPSQKKA